MAKKFERLFQAWVLGFRDRYLRWAHPKARPWEHSCRKHDGKCGTRDSKMILCDHCDASYGIECLKLQFVPDGAWHCQECKHRLKKVKEISLMSAVSEAAARKKAELGDVPKKKVSRTMFLVKWAGLGYEFCTWETKEDINDDNLIDEYHRLNNMTPDEPDLAEEVANEVLKNIKHLSASNAGGIACMPELRAQLYAQSRAFQFTKFGYDLPAPLAADVGTRTNAAYTIVIKDEDETRKISNSIELVECIGDLVHRVVRANSQPLMNVNASLPPLLTGEYDAIIPITSKGLMMNVGEVHGSVAFLGYRIFPDGSKGPAEVANLIRNVGDKIIAVDGASTVDKTFKDVILMLRDSGKNKYAFMRFLENRYGVCSGDLTSVGNMGRYTVEELHRKFSTDRQRMLVQRKQHILLEDEVKIEKVIEEDDDDESVQSDNTNEESEEDGSEGEFEPDSEDDEVVRNPIHAVSEKISDGATPVPVVLGHQPSELTVNTENVVSSLSSVALKVSEVAVNPDQETILLKQEGTRSLAFRLLDMDVGYSSDEGGEDDCAFFIDGVDQTFSTKSDCEKMNAMTNDAFEEMKKFPQKSKSKARREKESDEEVAAQEFATVPVKRNEFINLGDRSKLNAAIALTMLEPDPTDFENFPGLSNRELDEAEKKATEESEKLAAAVQAKAVQEKGSPTKSTKRSTVKVEQISASTGEILRIWANAESAAATLQVPLDEIRRMLRGEVEEDFADDVGGYRWQFALVGADVTKIEASNGRGSKKGKDAYLEFRDKLYDPAEPHYYKNSNRLRDYQIDGVNWLSSTWYKQHSCILADEMGKLPY